MSNDRLPKIIFYSELKDGARSRGGQSSGVAGPLAAWGGGQICRPFVLAFGVMCRTGRSQRPNVVAQDTQDRYALQL